MFPLTTKYYPLKGGFRHYKIVATVWQLVIFIIIIIMILIVIIIIAKGKAKTKRLFLVDGFPLKSDKCLEKFEEK